MVAHGTWTWNHISQSNGLIAPTIAMARRTSPLDIMAVVMIGKITVPRSRFHENQPGSVPDMIIFRHDERKSSLHTE